MSTTMESPQVPAATPGHRNRSFSYRSDRSNGSKTSSAKVKDELAEDPREKKRRDSLWKTSKANPNAALDEAQPVERQAGEAATIDSLREMQHKDTNGIPIAEPDLSNPTRPRWERPLDTIRSFERSIDNGYKRRSYGRPDSYSDQPGQYANRRSSSYGYNPNQNGAGQYGGGGGYYGNRGSMVQDNGYGPGGPANPRQRHASRMQSDAAIRNSAGNGNGGYPQHGYHGSYDTVNTGASDSTGPWGNSTDPSSENSSLDRLNVPMKPQDPYAPQNGGYGGAPNNLKGPIMEEGSGDSYGAYQQQYLPPNGNMRPYGAPPVQPPYGAGRPQRPIPLGGGGGMPSIPSNLPAPPRPEPEKRKSWLKRTFSIKK